MTNINHLQEAKAFIVDKPNSTNNEKILAEILEKHFGRKIGYNWKSEYLKSVVEEILNALPESEEICPRCEFPVSACEKLQQDWLAQQEEK